MTTTGYPKLVFDGTLKDGEITIKLKWGSILTTGKGRSGAATVDEGEVGGGVTRNIRCLDF